MVISSSRQSVPNPRAFPVTGVTVMAAEIGPRNVASYVYNRLKIAQVGDTITINFYNIPELDKTIQFGKLIDLINNDTWMKHVLNETDMDTNRLLFLNSVSVVYQ